MNDLFLSVSIFVLILVVMIILRLKFGKKFEIKNSDILIALIPVVLWLMFTGKIHKLEFGEFKIEAAFIEASKTSVAKQITPVNLPVEPVIMHPKGGVEKIPQLVKNKTEALVFQLGYGLYWGPAIEEYLKRLSEYPFLKYIIISDRDSRFIGMINARELNSLFMYSGTDFNPRNFAIWINRSDITSLSKLPGFMSASNAIRKDTDKQTALEKMEKINIDTLPVIDKQGKFAGVVERSRLTASLIIDVANKCKR